MAYILKALAVSVLHQVHESRGLNLASKETAWYWFVEKEGKKKQLRKQGRKSEPARKEETETEREKDI